MLEQLRDIVERPGLGNLHLLEQARHCLAQSPAKQRVVVRNNQTRRITHPLHLRLESSWAIYGHASPAYHNFNIAGPLFLDYRTDGPVHLPAAASLIWVDFAA